MTAGYILISDVLGLVAVCLSLLGSSFIIITTRMFKPPFGLSSLVVWLAFADLVTNLSTLLQVITEFVSLIILLYIILFIVGDIILFIQFRPVSYYQ